MFKQVSCVALYSAILLAAAPAKATAVVTFYTDRASFNAATANRTVLNFEGIATDTGFHNFGPSYHTGSVTFTSPSNPSNEILVVGSHSQTLGAPFDSALLIPSGYPSTLLATFDPSSNITAVGGSFMGLQGPYLGRLTLTGAGGVLDMRQMPVGDARQGHDHGFIGYTVTGDTIASVSLYLDVTGPAFDDFTYGVVPGPASLSAVLSGALVFLRRRRVGGRIAGTC